MLECSYQSLSGCDKAVLKTILLVEDNLEDVFLIKNMLLAELEESGLRLTHVESLNNALRCLEEEYFDIVLLDLCLPGSQGIDALLCVQSKAPDLPIVVLTDLDSDVLPAQLIAQGVHAYLIKNHISQSWLKSAIALAMARSASVSQQYQYEQCLEQSNQVLQGQIRAYVDEIDRLKEELQALSTLASTDGLTEVANRYCFEQYFA